MKFFEKLFVKNRINCFPKFQKNPIKLNKITKYPHTFKVETALNHNCYQIITLELF